MRICMFSNLYPPVVSGSSTQSSSLARELAKRGHEVCVVTARVGKDTPAYEKKEGVHVYRLPAIHVPRLSITFNFPWLSHTFLPGNLRRIRAILDKHRPDVLHAHNHMFDLALSAVWMRRRLGLPLVVTIHTVIKHSNPLFNLVLYPADRLAIKALVINRAERLICPDMNIAGYIKEAFGREGEPLIPYGIELPEPPGAALVETLRERYALHGKRIILSVGHIHGIRHRKDLVEAMPHVREVFPNTVLLMVGMVGTDIPAEAARAAGVADAVIFTGPLPHDEVVGLLALADLEGHWLSQEEVERTSLGVATLEAMASGKATMVVANPNTHGEGVIRSGENILLVERDRPRALAQTIIDLLGDDARRAAIGDRAQQTIRAHFSWESVCEKTLAVYRGV